MIAQGTDAKDVTAEQIATVRSDLDAFRRQHQINLKELAQSLGVGHATISEFLSGKYRGNNAELAVQADDWMVSEEKRRARPATTTFTWTNVAQQIQTIAHYALDRRKISLAYGPDTSGMGKTTALNAIHRDLGPRRSALATIDKVDANPTGLLRKLCVACHINDNGTNKARFDRLVEHLQDRSHLLMIDQIHNLRWAKDDKPLYILADLYEHRAGAQLWCGTADMVGYLNRQRVKSSDESLAQIRSRIFPCVDLIEALESGGEDGKGAPLVTVEQVREAFGKNRLKLTAAAARFVCALCNIPDDGGMRFAAQLVEYATELAPPTLTSIDLPQLKQALRHAVSNVRAEQVVADVTRYEQRIARVS